MLRLTLKCILITETCDGVVGRQDCRSPNIETMLLFGCSRNREMWRFNEHEQKCETFLIHKCYSDCKGNIYNSENDCNAKCVSHKNK